MAPRFIVGDLIIFEPGRVPQDGDDAVLIFQPKRNSTAQCLWIRTVVKQSAKTLTVKQYNPHAIQKVSRRRIASVSRIMTTKDLLG